MLFSQMTVIGVGLIGGSLALAAKRAKLVETVVGYSKKRGDLYKALSMGVLDRYCLNLQKAIEGADLVVLATPVRLLVPMASAIASFLKKGAVVTDVGSFKGEGVSQIEAALAPRALFVGGHPMAGREQSGVMAALPALFENSISILTPTPKTDQKALQKVALLWKGVGSSVVYLDPHQHDQAMALVSHLPHFVAYALMELFFHHRVTKQNPLPFAGGSLRDFTRIADSSHEVWHDIFSFNKEALLDAVDLYQETLEKLKKALVQAKVGASEGDALFRILKRAKVIRQAIRS